MVIQSLSNPLSCMDSVTYIRCPGYVIVETSLQNVIIVCLLQMIKDYDALHANQLILKSQPKVIKSCEYSSIIDTKIIS